MRTEEKREFANALSAVAVTFGTELDKPILAAYWMALSDLDLNALQSACSRALRELTFFPKPAELRKLAGIVASSSRAMLAWESVAKTTQRLGARRSVDFDDPVINATVRSMGGWERLCRMEREEFAVWGRKEFERIYSALCDSGISEDAGRYLPGQTERENPGLEAEVRTVPAGLPPHSRSVVNHMLGGGGRQLLESA